MRFESFELHPDYAVHGAEKRDGSVPKLDAYLLDDAQNPFRRKAVIVFPGGGYTYLSKREGEPVAMKFLAAGFQTFILWYSISPSVFPCQLVEAAEAVRTVRTHAESWNIDPDQIYVLGLSAGGNLAAMLSTMWHREFLYKGFESADIIKPNGTILGYTVMTWNRPEIRKRDPALLRGLGPEYFAFTDLPDRVDEHTPPTFIWATWTDEKVDIKNTLLYIDALREHRVSCEAHIFAKGVHGLSVATRETRMDPAEDPEGRSVNTNVQVWTSLAIAWLESM